MVRKTRKHYSHKSKKQQGIYSIPEIRRSFEYIEEFIDKKINDNESKQELVKLLRKEWSKVFLKDLDKKSAEVFIEDRFANKHKRYRHKTLRRKGGASPITGSPLDYVTRQGLYLAPGQIPDQNGHLPLSNGAVSNYGNFIQYVDKGFWNPEIAQSYDSIQGQSKWPIVPAGMGSNLVKGGGRKLRRGGAVGSLLSQAFTRPIPSSSPPSVLQDMQNMWYGKEVGPSPDQIQRQPSYQLGSLYPKPITF